MNAHIKSEIDAYLDGSLPESRRRDVDAHVSNCESCRKALHRERSRRAHQHREALKKASAGWVPDLFLRRQGRSQPAPAAGLPWGWILFVLAALAAVGLYFRGPAHRGGVEPRVPAAPAPAIAPPPARAVVQTPAPRLDAESPARPVPAMIEPAVETSSPVIRRRRPAVAVSSPAVPVLPATPPAIQPSTGAAPYEPPAQP